MGPKSEACLIEIGIETPEALRAIGAVTAFIRLKKQCSSQPSLNFLYALVGAVEGKSWLKVAKSEKGRLLMELEGYHELEKMFQEEGIEI